MSTILGIIFVLAWYLIPTWVAWWRHHQIGMVAVLNFFLGWTVIGWVAALAIACGDRSKHQATVAS